MEIFGNGTAHFSLAVEIGSHGAGRREAALLLPVLTAIAMDGREGKLEEEKGSSVLPIRQETGAEMEGMTGIEDKAALPDQLVEVDAVVDEVTIKGFIEGEKATAPVKAAVIALDGEGRRETGRQVGPTAAGKLLEEKDIEKGTRVGAGTASAFRRFGRRDQRGEDGPLGIGEEGDSR